MKRKFLSTLLFGALACTTLSTVTSCKDYDDDINNLQEQIDKKAALDKVNDLITQVSNVETQAKSAYDLAASKASKEDVAAAQTAATEAAKKAAQEIADAASTKADAAAAAAKAAQETADQAVKDAAAANKAAEEVAGKLKDYVLASELKTQLENLKKELEDGSIKELEDKVKGYDNAINALYSAVTEVSLVGSFQGFGLDKYIPMGSYGHTLYVKSGSVKKNFKFGEKELDDKGGEHHANTVVEYKENTQFGFADKLLIRVNPVNATVTKDMIKLVDSKGNDLEGVLEVSAVEKYDDMIYRNYEFTPNETQTRAAGNKTGLWLVYFQPKKSVTDINKEVVAGTSKGSQTWTDGDGNKHEETGTYTQRKLYAVAVNNTANVAKQVEDAANRYVVSTYDVMVYPQSWYNYNKSLHAVNVYSENSLGKKKAVSLAGVKARETVTTDGTTNDHNGTVIPAQSGENVVVDFSGLNGQAEYFYVVRDDSHAGESDASEINAWNAYQYAGLNTIYPASKDGKVTVTIPASAKAGDEICFRVFAVNYDGTYVAKGDGEADGTTVSSTGHSFSVYVTSQNTSASVTGNILATKAKGAETDYLPITGSISDAGEQLATVTKVDNKTVAVAKNFTLAVSDEESWNVSATFYQDAKGTPATKNSEIKYVKFTSKDVMTSWTDGATASLAYQIKESAHQTITDVFNISLTKELPTAADAKAKIGYSWKDKQLVNGVYTAYLYPTGDQWNVNTGANASNAVASGYKVLTQAINVKSGNAQAYLEIADAKQCTGSDNHADNKKFYDKSLYVYGSDWKMIVSNAKDAAGTALIDNKTEHKAVFGYNYGKISSAKKNAQGQFEDYKVTVDEDAFKIVFACPLNNTVQTFKFNNYVIAATATSPEEQIAPNVLYYNDATKSANDAKLPSGHKSISRYLVASNTFDNSVFGGSWYGNDWKTGDAFKKYDLANSKVELVSNGTGTVDYFNAKFNSDGQIVFEQISGTTNPPSDVPSTLKLTLRDCFGHDNPYSIDFTVLRRPNE